MAPAGRVDLEIAPNEHRAGKIPGQATGLDVRRGVTMLDRVIDACVVDGRRTAPIELDLDRDRDVVSARNHRIQAVVAETSVRRVVADPPSLHSRSTVTCCSAATLCSNRFVRGEGYQLDFGSPKACARTSEWTRLSKKRASRMCSWNR